jgi:O-antigen/teichoic acid export membrane protein
MTTPPSSDVTDPILVAAAAAVAAPPTPRRQGFSLRGETVRNVAVVFSGTAIASALGILTTFVLVRHLAPAEYGILSVMDMVVGVSAGLLATGINWSLVRTVAATRDDPEKVASAVRRVLEVELAYGLVVAVGLFLGADFIAQRLLHHPELTFYVRLCSVGVVGSILFEFRRAILQAFKQFRLDAAFGIVQSAAYLAIVLVLLGTGVLRIRLLSVAYVTLPLVIALIAIALLLRRHLVTKSGTGRSDFFRNMAASYGWLLCYTICLWVVGQVHVMVLTRYFALHEVGIYGFSNKIYMIALMLMTAVKAVTLPAFSELTERAALRGAYHRALRGTTLASIFLWGSIPLIGFVVHLFAGGRYADSTAIIQIFMVGAAINTILSPASQVVISLEKFGVLAAAGLAAVMLNVGGHLLVTARFGGTSAAAVQVGTHVLLNGIFAVVADHELRVPARVP